MSVEIGSEAPDFTLRNERGEEVALSSLRGKNVVLVFYPLAFSPICTKELHDISALKDKIADANAEVFGISVDSSWVLRAFKRDEDLSAHLLSDFHPKGAVAKQYGAYLDDLGIATRATFVIDKNGKVVDKAVTSPGEARNQDDVIAALAACTV